MATRTLSEADSRVRLRDAGVPVSPFVLLEPGADATAAIGDLDGPFVAKLCGDTIAHKSERGLVRLGLPDAEAVAAAAAELFAAAVPDDGAVTVLVSTMIEGKRELIAGMATDAQFGPVVMIGVGGVLAEAIDDVAIRLVPLSDADAHDMIDQLRTTALLEAFRGEPPVDRDALVEVIQAIAAHAEADPAVVSIDCNPLIISDGRPIAVDALVEVHDGNAA